MGKHILIIQMFQQPSTHTHTRMYVHIYVKKIFLIMRESRENAFLI